MKCLILIIIIFTMLLYAAAYAGTVYGEIAYGETVLFTNNNAIITTSSTSYHLPDLVIDPCYGCIIDTSSNSTVVPPLNNQVDYNGPILSSITLTVIVLIFFAALWIKD